jgi:hypothetical protein
MPSRSPNVRRAHHHHLAQSPTTFLHSPHAVSYPNARRPRHHRLAHPHELARVTQTRDTPGGIDAGRGWAGNLWLAREGWNGGGRGAGYGETSGAGDAEPQTRCPAALQANARRWVASTHHFAISRPTGDHPARRMHTPLYVVFLFSLFTLLTV